MGLSARPAAVTAAPAALRRAGHHHARPARGRGEPLHALQLDPDRPVRSRGGLDRFRLDGEGALAVASARAMTMIASVAHCQGRREAWITSFTPSPPTDLIA